MAVVWRPADTFARICTTSRRRACRFPQPAVDHTQANALDTAVDSRASCRCCTRTSMPQTAARRSGLGWLMFARAFRQMSLYRNRIELLGATAWSDICSRRPPRQRVTVARLRRWASARLAAREYSADSGMRKRCMGTSSSSDRRIGFFAVRRDLRLPSICLACWRPREATRRCDHTRFSLEDVFCTGGATSSQVNGWRRLPHVDPSGEAVAHRHDCEATARASSRAASPEPNSGALLSRRTIDARRSEGGGDSTFPSAKYQSSDKEIAAAVRRGLRSVAALEERRGSFVAATRRAAGSRSRRTFLTQVLAPVAMRSWTARSTDRETPVDAAISSRGTPHQSSLAPRVDRERSTPPHNLHRSRFYTSHNARGRQVA
jgi:hypothetical protein